MSRRNPNRGLVDGYKGTRLISLLSIGLLELYERQRGIYHLLDRPEGTLGHWLQVESHRPYRFRISVRHEISLSSELSPKLAPTIPRMRASRTSTIIWGTSSSVNPKGERTTRTSNGSSPSGRPMAFNRDRSRGS